MASIKRPWLNLILEHRAIMQSLGAYKKFGNSAFLEPFEKERLQSDVVFWLHHLSSQNLSVKEVELIKKYDTYARVHGYERLNSLLSEDEKNRKF